jgi:hypothetical protein
MAVTHELAVRNGIADYVVDLIDVGGSGTLEFQTVGSTAAATVTFQATAFGAAAAGVATRTASIIADSSAVGGTVTKFVIKSGAGTALINGLVAVSGQDVDLDNLTIGVGATVSMTNLTYEAPP